VSLSPLIICAIRESPVFEIRIAMKADIDAAIEAFGKNEQVKKVFWTLFISMAGLVLARVVDPALAAKVVAVLAGI
jgi:hypothetical protein